MKVKETEIKEKERGREREREEGPHLLNTSAQGERERRKREEERPHLLNTRAKIQLQPHSPAPPPTTPHIHFMLPSSGQMYTDKKGSNNFRKLVKFDFPSKSLYTFKLVLHY